MIASTPRPSRPLLALRLAVTGARSLRSDQVSRLREQLRAVFAQVRRGGGMLGERTYCFFGCLCSCRRPTGGLRAALAVPARPRRRPPGGGGSACAGLRTLCAD